MLKSEYVMTPFLYTMENLKSRTNLVKIRQGMFSNRFNTDNVCPICKTQSNNTVTHVILECGDLEDVRRQLHENMKPLNPGFQYLSNIAKLKFMLGGDWDDTNVSNIVIKFIDIFNRL